MRLRRRSLAALRIFVCAIAVAAPAASASASECAPVKGFTGCVDSDNLWMSAGATRFFSIGPGLTTPALKYSFGFGLSYLSRPIAFRVSTPNPSGDLQAVVDNVLDASFLWSLGITDRLQLSLVAPLTL